ncbi:methionine synthase, vitamin-B12 independent [Aspergillus venezuelensis]
MNPPVRADHIGSLMRPEELLKIRSALHKKQYDPEPLPEEAERITNEAIAGAVRRQQSLFFKSITSGEYDRTIFFSGFLEYLQGMQGQMVPLSRGRKGNPSMMTLERLGAPHREAAVAIGPIRFVKSNYLVEWERLRRCLPESQWKYCKMTVVPITWEHVHLAPGAAYTPESGYTSDKQYLGDLADAMAEEWRLLHAAGLRKIQVDDPAWLYFVNDEMRANCDADALLDLYIWAHNKVLAQRPSGLHVGVHLCRGNFPNSRRVMDEPSSYERIAARLFNELDYNTFYLEYDTDLCGGFSPLRQVPVGKNVVLGLVSTKDPELEDVDSMVRSVYEAADVIAQGQGRSRQEALDCLGVSPQCGFSSLSGGNGKGMTSDIMWQKLELVQDIARKIWPEEHVL